MATKRRTSTSAKSSKAAKTSRNTKSSSASNSATRGTEPILKRAKSVGWLAVLESLVIGAFGVIMLWNPDGFLRVVFYVIGIFLIVKGVYHIINYFVSRGRYDFYNNDLLYGIIALIFGILIVVLWEQLSGAIGIVVGAWLIYSALVRMNTAIKLHAAKVKTWFYVLLLALILLVLGIYVIVNFNVAVQAVGIVMIVAAVIGVIEELFFIRNVKVIVD